MATTSEEILILDFGSQYTQLISRRIREAHPDEVLPGGPCSPESQAISRDLVNRALEAVDERTGEIALLTWGQGMTNARVAELLDTSTRTIIRARKRFEDAVAKLEAEEAP